jgi:phosphoenolpyruvate carboxykinase (ATP)
VLLTADAFGVLPPVARLTRDQALYWFLSGYTSKLAGTEKGVDEPEATFSACFGAPFLPLPPVAYANLLGERIDRHQPALWLVNTGWGGGAYGTGERMPIAMTRSIVTAIIDGSLAETATTPDPIFGLHVPNACQGVPDHVLQPRKSWPDSGAYDRTAKRLADAIVENFVKFEGSVSPGVAAARPTTGNAANNPG